MNTTKLKLTGLWKNTDKNGKAYYAGSLSPTVRLLVFTNSFKEGERDPDLVVYLVPAEKKPAASAERTEESPRPAAGQDVPF